MLKLKLQYFGHLMQRTDSLEKTLMLGKIEGRRRRGRDNKKWNGWMASPTWWTWVWVDSGSWWWTEKPGMLQSVGSQRVRHDWVTKLNWIQNWVPVMQSCRERGAIAVTLSKLALLAAWQANESERWGFEAKDTTLLRKPANWEDGRLKSKSNHFVGVWKSGSFTEPERGAMRN